MRWWSCLLILLAGCASTWERHQARLAENEARGDYARAAAQIHWQIDNAFTYGAAADNMPAAEAARYLHLSDLETKNGNASSAIEALQEALRADPHQAGAVRARLGRLPVSAPERERLKQEFAWNIAALLPAADALPHSGNDVSRCWSYRVREIRIRYRRTAKVPEGMQRRAIYDARPWIFDAEARQWRAEGDWVEDAGSEAELVGGAEQPRYRAVTAADHQFYSDDSVPPCHRTAWVGPYDPNGTVFVAARLPISQSTPK